MNRYWTHAAMLLLGISLTAGFYEGRRLVKNTAKALNAASLIGTTADRKARRGEDVPAPDIAAALDEESSPPPARNPDGRRGKKGRKGGRREGEARSHENRIQRIDPQMMRSVRPTIGGLPRTSRASPMAPGGVTPGLLPSDLAIDLDDLDLPEPEPLDTGLD